MKTRNFDRPLKRIGEEVVDIYMPALNSLPKFICLHSGNIIEAMLYLEC